MSSESNFSFTTKIDGDLLTIRGDSFAEFVLHLSEASGSFACNNLLTVLNGQAPAVQNVAPVTVDQAVQNVTAAFPGAHVVEQQQMQAPSPAFAPVAPPVAPVAPTAAVAGAKHCKHGAMVARSGTSAKTGKPWSGYFCPSPKGTPDQCDPEFGR